MRHLFLVTSVALLALSSASVAQNNVQNFTPVTQQMLENPRAEDWLMYSRTHDAQRFSPLDQISRQNVSQLREVFKKELGVGAQESIPIVYQGVHLPGRARRERPRSRWDDRRDDLGAQAAVGHEPDEGDRHLRGHGLSTRLRMASSWPSMPAPVR